MKFNNFKKNFRTVVITGASAGIGRATACAFAREGCNVELIARGIDGLEAAQKDVERLGGRALIFPLDVSDYHALEEAMRNLERVFGPVDVWVNNAMLSVFSPVKEMKAEEYQRVTEVTYLGYVYGTLLSLKSMLQRNHGTIIQVSSALGFRSIPLQSAYCAAKHAVNGFTESLRTELLHDRSAVKLVRMDLPAVNTPQFSWVKSRLPRAPQPVPPIFQPEVIADAIVFACRHPRRNYGIAWPVLKAKLGEMFVPRYTDRYLAKRGYDSQQTQEPVAKNREDNLWQPLAGDHGAHGTFDRRAKKFSLEFWFSKHRDSAGIIVLAALLVIIILSVSHQR